MSFIQIGWIPVWIRKHHIDHIKSWHSVPVPDITFRSRAFIRLSCKLQTSSRPLWCHKGYLFRSIKDHYALLQEKGAQKKKKIFSLLILQGRPQSFSEVQPDFCPGCLPQFLTGSRAGIWRITVPAQKPALWKIKSCWQFFVRPQVSVLTSECPHVICAPAAIPVHHRDCSWPSAGR